MAEDKIARNAFIDMHLPGGYTKLRLDIGPVVYFDVPTAAIPPHLRKLGSKVLFAFTPATCLPTEDECRERHHGIIVTEPEEN